MKPTSTVRTHFRKCPHSRLKSFFGSLVMQSFAAKLQPARQPRFHWSGRAPRVASTRHPASPRPHAANEENDALRKAIEDADNEYGVGLLA